MHAAPATLDVTAHRLGAHQDFEAAGEAGAAADAAAEQHAALLRDARAAEAAAEAAGAQRLAAAGRQATAWQVSVTLYISNLNPSLNSGSECSGKGMTMMLAA